MEESINILIQTVGKTLRLDMCLYIYIYTPTTYIHIWICLHILPWTSKLTHKTRKELSVHLFCYSIMTLEPSVFNHPLGILESWWCEGNWGSKKAVAELFGGVVIKSFWKLARARVKRKSSQAQALKRERQESAFDTEV